MRHVFITIFFVSTIFFIGGCKQVKQFRKEEQRKHNTRMKNSEIEHRKKILKKIKYTKDLRTGFCFAYYETSHMHGESFSLAHVPCDKIPAKLLK